MIKLLDGVRVLESGALYNASGLGLLLADLGADVIKIESPFRGDYIRNLNGNIAPDWSVGHLQANRNKRSVTLDLRDDEAKAVFWRLLDTAEVFVDGNKWGACDRFGIGYEAQRARRPDIIYCHHTGFGVKGPYAEIPTHGTSTNALAGKYHPYVGEDGLVHEGPPLAGWGGTERGADGPIVGAMIGALCTVAAIVQKLRHGGGAFIDVAAVDACVASAWIPVVFGLNDHRVTDRSELPFGDTTEMAGAKLNNYRTRDGQFVHFACMEHSFWNRFCEAVDRTDLIARNNLDAPADYAPGDVELRREIQRIIEQRDLAEWVELARREQIPINPAYSNPHDLLADPHFSMRDVLVEGSHPAVGDFTYFGFPAMVDAQPFEIRRPAPALGEHTADLLTELGLSATEIDQLRDRQAI